MSSRPVVGITSYGREHGPRGPSFSLPSAYVDAVRRAGGFPVLIPPGERVSEQVLSHVDALVFAGGGDLSPGISGGGPHPKVYSVDEERDRFELELMRMALDHELPTMAICRGMQVLNVARGGTLHAHLPDVVGEGVAHRAPPLDPIPHRVQIDSDSKLAAIYGETDLEIASWHHQAVNQIGEDLRPVAWASDGIVEALELEGAPWLLAVQWHPELEREEDGPQRLLFAALIGSTRRL